MQLKSIPIKKNLGLFHQMSYYCPKRELFILFNEFAYCYLSFKKYPTLRLSSKFKLSKLKQIIGKLINNNINLGNPK